MSDGYSKVTCPNCGVHIEYPSDTEFTSFPCPECSARVPLKAGPQSAREETEKLLAETGLFEPAHPSINSVVQAAAEILSRRPGVGNSGKPPKLPRMGWMQISVLDKETTEICQGYAFNQWNENFEPVGDSLPYDGGCPRHRGCRAVVVPVNLDEPVPEDMDFDSYLAQFSREEQEAAFEKRALRAYHRGEMTASQLVESAREKLMFLAKRIVEERL
jgi:predicted RNA-binding Zn-ribbon protein involved in translation (DUF1610 family)